MTPLIAIPAAGASLRMRGRDKLLEQVDDMPLLRRQTLYALRTGCPVRVFLPPGDPGDRRGAALSGLDVSTEAVPEAGEGMSGSLRQAAMAAGDGPLCILLPDVPGITTSDIRAVLDAFEAIGGSTPVRGSDPDGRPGTPLCVPARLLPAFRGLSGDDGGRGVLSGEMVELVKFPDDRATRDLDTPEAWASWRAERRQQD